MGFDIVLIKCGVDNELEFDFFVSKLLSCRPGTYVSDHSCACVYIHTGVGHTDKGVSITFLTRKKLANVSCAPPDRGSIRTSGHRILRPTFLLSFFYLKSVHTM